VNREALDDWTVLAEQWRSAPESTALGIDALRTRIRRQTIRLYLVVALELVLTVAALGGIAAGLAGASDWPTRVLLIALLLFSMRIWVFTLRNRQGIWRPTAETLEGFRALERRRLERKLASARFVWRFCFSSLIVLAAWAAWRAPELTPNKLWVVVAGGVYLALWIAGALIVRRSVARALDRSRTDDEPRQSSGDR
jgi:hypothetical protein